MCRKLLLSVVAVALFLASTSTSADAFVATSAGRCRGRRAADDAACWKCFTVRASAAESRHRRVRPRDGLEMAAYNPNDELRAMVQRKQYEVKKFLEGHSEPHDPLQLRLSYAATESSYELREALRLSKGLDDAHRTVVVADIKRRSPTAAELRPDVASFDDTADWAAKVHAAGAQVLMVNTDLQGWGGRPSDLDAVVAHFRRADARRPPIVAKDVIVHPIQMAWALEQGASATVLIACVLGPALRDLMDVATTMGTEAIVEVHTPAELLKVKCCRVAYLVHDPNSSHGIHKECEKALEHGPSVIMVNNWDRITGKLYPKQAGALRRMIPHEILTIAAGGIDTLATAAALSDEGYDAVVLGRSLVPGGGGGPGRGAESGPDLIRGISGREGVPRNLLGWGVTPEDVKGIR